MPRTIDPTSRQQLFALSLSQFNCNCNFLTYIHYYLDTEQKIFQKKKDKGIVVFMANVLPRQYNLIVLATPLCSYWSK